MRWFLLFLMCGAAAWIPAHAQTRHAKAPAAQPERYPIQTLTVEGNRNYTTAQILAVAGLKLKQLAGKADFDAARDRLVATGDFETVGYKFAPSADGHGYAANFQVVEAQPAYPIQFEKLGVPDKDLMGYLRGQDPLFAPFVAATKQALDRYTKWVQDYVTAHGGKDKIIAKMVPSGPGQMTIVFRPERADPPVAEVHFEGNQVIPTAALQKAISEVAIGVPYQEDRFRQFLDAAVRPLYDARGRVRVAFPNVTIEKAKDVEGLVVMVSVEEGGSYNLGNVGIQGAPDFEPGDLLKAGKFKSGELADFDEVGKGVDRIRKVLAHEGFVNSNIQIVRRIDESRKTVNVTLKIDEGPQYRFSALTVEGLDLNGEAAIRKMWTQKTGQPYNPDYARHFLDRVKEDGVFDNLGETRYESNIDDKTHTVQVTLYFKGAPPKKEKKRGGVGWEQDPQ